MDKTSFQHTADGIDWYCEMRGSGPAIVLIPSGEGDCSNFESTAAILASRFQVLTFDTPGYSRSSAPTDPTKLSVSDLAAQIAALVQSLGLGPAAYYGCSSGGRAVLDLTANFSSLMTAAIVHEAALSCPVLDAQLNQLVALDDAMVVAVCRDMFAKVMNEDEAAWNALGSAYHQRLERNYITWVRHYVAKGLGAPIDPDALRGRPINWTIGTLSHQEAFAGNRVLADAAGIAIGTMPCRHFPQVSMPDVLAGHISNAILQSHP